MTRSILFSILGIAALAAAEIAPPLPKAVQADPAVALRRARITAINEKIRAARLQPARLRPIDITKLIVLGPEVFMDLRTAINGYQLPVRDQGPRGTCSVHALAFCQEYMTCQKQNQTGLNHSVEYLNWAGNVVLGQPYHDGGFYADLDHGYQTYGAVGEATAPYQASFNASWAPTAAAVTSGKTATRHSAVFIKPWDNTKGASQAQLNDAIAHLKLKRPVALGALWPNSLQVQAVDGVDLMVVPSRAATFDGHSVVLVGYHKSAKYPGGGYFIFRNSWGKNWGDNGYGHMPFKYVLDLANDLLVYK